MKRFRVVVVSWLTENYSDTDYEKDFIFKRNAIKYIKKHKKDYEKEYEEYKDNLCEIDIDIETWDKSLNILKVENVLRFRKEHK